MIITKPSCWNSDFHVITDLHELKGAEVGRLVVHIDEEVFFELHFEVEDVLPELVELFRGKLKPDAH